MIVVTGGAGFIGSALIWKLNALGQNDILVVDALGQDDKWKNLTGLAFRDYMERQDFLREIVAGRMDGGIDAILHMGACSSTTERDVSFLAQNNFAYTRELAQFCLRQEARFIYASSAATYGDGCEGYSDDHEQIHRLKPLNAYAFSKQLFDTWALRNGALDTIVGLKYFNVYGPNEWHKGDMRSMVCKGFEQIRETGKIRLFRSDKPEYPDGGQKRDFVYVKDAVDMTLFFLENRDPAGIYNVGTGAAATWNALLGAVFQAMDLPEKIEYISMPESLQGRYQYFTQARMDKLAAAGYTQPVTPLKEAVADYVTQYLQPGKNLGGAPLS